MRTKLLPCVVGAMLLNHAAAESAGGSQVPPRSQISDEYKWKITDIYANDSEWDKGFVQLRQLIPTMTKYKGKLASSAADLAACLKARDQIGITGGKLYAYARLHRDENNNDTKYQALTGKAETLLTEASAAASFIEPEILAIPESQLAKFRQAEKELAVYSFYFDNLLRQKKHILSPAEEEILSRASEATQASETTFNMLAHADMKFPQISDSKGNKLQLSESRYRTYIMSPDRQLRQQAFTHLFGAYNQYRNTFASTLGGNVKKNIFYTKTRKYNSTIESALEGDNVPVQVYDNLINTVHKRLPLLHRYVALKKKALELDEIHMYDLYTPLVRNVELEYKYPEALELVQKGLEPMGDEYLSVLKQGLSSGWIDVYENQGKQTGAYSWGVYQVHPFVLLNYTGRYDDVSTIAHEMGHAIHSYYSQKHQPYATSSYTIFSAEIASTTNETLLMDYMLKTTKDSQVRMYLINQYLESVRATVYRQTMFAEFEKLLYEKVEDGESVTADFLDEIWHDLNAKYYGSDIVVDKEIDVEWARIPHFYSSFYVYQYVTGFSAANAFAASIQQEGAPARERYLNFLKSGGSDYSLNLLKKAGVDMSSPEPIEVTLAKFEKMLDELEKLLRNS
ncbi:oligoendopeptidase F [Acetonema longum]